MMQQWLEKLKTGKKDQMMILLLLGVLLLVIAVPVREEGEAVAGPAMEDAQELIAVNRVSGDTQVLEQQLGRMLSQVAGIGKAEVMITLKSDGKRIIEKDQEYVKDQEQSAQDSIQNANSSVSERENTVYEKDSQGNETPYVSSSLAPEIAGVLVIAQGAGNSSVTAEITEAVMALFGVEAHKIKVMKMQ